MSTRTRSNGLIRCAIYTRKSTEEGLEQEFNSLDAQREAGEAYIASQKSEGWVCLPDRYDDGGFTGGNMERPALKRLLSDIEAGRVDCVVVYKVDRLSRSLLDFARIMETFEKHGVSFVSVTQQFNTSTSMGRLMLNVLLSFAQFEREIISERTRDKIAAARRKGKWSGGKPLLGYDLIRSPGGSRLVVNEQEAEQVRQIFRLYLRHERLTPVLRELDRRGWHTKRWTTQKGHPFGGQPFNRVTLYRLLTNVAYRGKVRHRDEVYEGEHEPIIDEALWRRVQECLRTNGRTGGMYVRNKHGALLKGLLYCGVCGRLMGHTYSVRKRNRCYRYYACYMTQKLGRHACPNGWLPAEQIERFVVQRIRAIGTDPNLRSVTLAQVRRQHKQRLAKLREERDALKRELRRLNARINRAARKAATDGKAAARLAELHDQLARAQRRLAEVQRQTAALAGQTVGRQELDAMLEAFDPVWDSLTPQEQARLLRLLIERIEYDRQVGRVAITLRPAGIRTLAAQAQKKQEVKA